MRLFCVSAHLTTRVFRRIPPSVRSRTGRRKLLTPRTSLQTVAAACGDGPRFPFINSERWPGVIPAPAGQLVLGHVELVQQPPHGGGGSASHAMGAASVSSRGSPSSAGFVPAAPFAAGVLAGQGSVKEPPLASRRLPWIAHVCRPVLLPGGVSPATALPARPADGELHHLGVAVGGGGRYDEHVGVGVRFDRGTPVSVAGSVQPLGFGPTAPGHRAEVALQGPVAQLDLLACRQLGRAPRSTQRRRP